MHVIVLCYKGNATLVSYHCDQAERCMVHSQLFQSASWLVEQKNQAVDEVALLLLCLHLTYHPQLSPVLLFSLACTVVWTHSDRAHSMLCRPVESSEPVASTTAWLKAAPVAIANIRLSVVLKLSFLYGLRPAKEREARKKRRPIKNQFVGGCTTTWLMQSAMRNTMYRPAK